jgi:hypothetical protein
VRAWTDDRDHVDAGREDPGVEAEDLPHEPLRPVARDGAPHLARRDDPEPGRVTVLARGEQEEDVRRADAAGAVALLDAEELAPLADALRSGEGGQGYFL